MKKNLLTKNYVIFPVIFCVHTLIISLVLSVIYPIKYSPHPLFYFELVNISFTVPFWQTLVYSYMNILLLWLISKNILKGTWRYLPALIYAMCLWPSYMTSANSFYVYLTTILLIMYYGVVNLKNNNYKKGIFFTSIGMVLSIYSSILVAFLLIIQVLLALFLKIFSFKQIKIVLIISTLLIFPLFVAAYLNWVGFKNVLNYEVRLFSNSGELHSVNLLRAESSKQGMILASKISENKYIYFSKYLIYKISENLSPVNFFVPKDKLLSFSFNSPIYLVFLVPFVVGLYFSLTSVSLVRYLGTLSVLIIPSLLAEKIVDSNRLIIIFPLIVLIITYGFMKISEIKFKFLTFFIYLTFFLLILEIFVSFFDIKSREFYRYRRIMGASTTIDRQ